MADKAKLGVSKPRDKSLEAYKAWIKGLVAFLNGEQEELSEVEWEQNWKEYWAEN